MKSILILIVLLAFACTSYAQNAAIDSMKAHIIRAKSDTQRIDLTNGLVYKMSEVNLDSAITLGKEVAIESRKLGYKKGEAEALSIVATTLLMKGNFTAAKKNLNEAMIIILSLKDSAMLANILGDYGMMYGMQSKYDSANIYYERSIAINEGIGNKAKLILSYGNLAIGYQMQSNYAQALYYQQKGLRLAEEQNNISSQAYINLNMGITYQHMEDFSRSEKALLTAIDFAMQIGIKNVEIYGYTNLASLYTSMEKWEDTYTYAMKAVKLAEETGDIPIEAASYSKAAVALANLKEYEEAKALIIKGMGDAEASGQPIIMSQLNSAMGNTLMLQDKYKEAIPYYEKCLLIFKNSDEYDHNIGTIYSNLAACYEQINAYEPALSNFKKYAAIKDSTRNKENIQKATELNMNYEFDKKQAVAKAEQDKKDIETRRIKNRQLFIIIVLGIIVLSVIIIALILLRNNKQKQKVNLLLKSQNQKVEATLSELKLTQSQLVQSEKMASLGELTAGIAHEIQNPLNFVNNFSEVSRELIDELEEERKKEIRNFENEDDILKDVKENLEKINHHGKRADAIVKGMLQHSRSSTGQKEPTDINALADEYLRLSYHGLRAKDKTFNASLETDFDESIGKVNISRQDIGRVLLNIINNSFYAVHEKNTLRQDQGDSSYKPTVTVSTAKMSPSGGGKGEVIISVKDNGNGIPQKVLDKIFQPFFTTKPTGQGTGLGLSLSYDIVKAHGGELKVETAVGSGTEFIIQLNIGESGSD